MIDITKIDKSDPYIIFEKFYNMALDKNQSNVEAIAISSYDIYNKQVDSRFVNLKYIIEQDWYFFRIMKDLNLINLKIIHKYQYSYIGAP